MRKKQDFHEITDKKTGKQEKRQKTGKTGSVRTLHLKLSSFTPEKNGSLTKIKPKQ